MPLGMHFYASLESVMQDESTLGYFSVNKRAWREMNLNGVLFLDGCPVLYLKEYARPFTEQERLYYHKLFWNQGVANILILADPEYIYIYSGLAKPTKNDWDEPATEKALVEKMTLADYARRLHALLHSLATGRYYEIAENQQKFDPVQAVDARLLGNLRNLRDALIQGDEGLEISIAHALIGRVLFLCYLLDRDIFTITKPDNICTGTARFFELLEKQGVPCRSCWITAKKKIGLKQTSPSFTTLIFSKMKFLLGRPSVVSSGTPPGKAGEANNLLKNSFKNCRGY